MVYNTCRQGFTISDLAHGTRAALPPGMRMKVSIQDVVTAAQALPSPFGVGHLLRALQERGHHVGTKRYVRQLIGRACAANLIEPANRLGREDGYRLVDPAERARRAARQSELEATARALGGKLHGMDILLTSAQAVELLARLARAKRKR